MICSPRITVSDRIIKKGPATLDREEAGHAPNLRDSRRKSTQIGQASMQFERFRRREKINNKSSLTKIIQVNEEKE